MNDADNLAEAWIRLHHIPKESRQSSEYDELFWSWEKRTEMCDSAPETAWDVIQEIIDRDHSDHQRPAVLWSLGELLDRLRADRGKEVDQVTVRIPEQERTVSPGHRCRRLNQGIVDHVRQPSELGIHIRHTKLDDDGVVVG